MRDAQPIKKTQGISICGPMPPRSSSTQMTTIGTPESTTSFRAYIESEDTIEVLKEQMASKGEEEEEEVELVVGRKGRRERRGKL